MKYHINFWSYLLGTGENIVQLRIQFCFWCGAVFSDTTDCISMKFAAYFPQVLQSCKATFIFYSGSWGRMVAVERDVTNLWHYLLIQHVMNSNQICCTSLWTTTTNFVTDSRGRWQRSKSHITKTYLYNFDPLKPDFYIVKLGFTWIYIIFLISAQKHRLWVLVRTASARRF